MAKQFREWLVDERWLFPPSVRELVPEKHLAYFVRDTVREQLDLSAIVDSYSEERGYPPYHPVMMTALLLYTARGSTRRGGSLRHASSGWTSWRSRECSDLIFGR
jgi:hypothetical protein